MSSSTKLTIGFSPCPNDCFIFDALVHEKIDTEGLKFEMLLQRILNCSLNSKSNFQAVINSSKKG
jgi:1,4-dihydroxy-6-naphthoate synthase